MKKRRLSKYLIVTSLMFSTFSLSSSALAATASGSFQVTATVAASCTISTAPLSFGNYVLNQIDSTSTITVTCTNGTAYGVSLDGGSNGTVGARRMAGPSGNFLNYALYSDSGRTTNWGAVTSSTSAGAGVIGTGSGSAQTLTVYGRVPASQTSIIGSYTDTINVTITF